MDIERAMEILDPEHRERYDSIETVNEACRMGREALRMLAMDREGDLVSREAVYETLSEYYHLRTEIQHIRLREALGLVLAADARPVVRGHWILDSTTDEPFRHRCDQCGATTTDTCMGKPRANWCPLCGAYMGEEGETLRTQQQLRKRKYVSRDRVFIEFADWANETGATNTQKFSDRLRAIPTVDVSEDTKDV